VRRNVVIAISAAALFAALWPASSSAQEMVDGDQPFLITLSIWQVVGTFVAIPASLFVALLLEWRERKNRLKQTTAALYLELYNHLTKLQLDNLKPDELANQSRIKPYTVTTKAGIEQEMYYINLYFETSAYDSVVHSGVMTQYPTELQLKVSKVYWTFKIHNESLSRFYLVRDQFFSEEAAEPSNVPWVITSQRYFVALTKWETTLRREIPRVQSDLEKLDNSMKDQSKSVAQAMDEFEKE
jgi:hypothetical protein